MNSMKTPQKLLREKKIIIFDVDGTIADSKLPIDNGMKQLLSKLLLEKIVVMIGGGKYELFKKQIVHRLPHNSELLRNLFLLPTNAASFYIFSGKWKNIYNKRISQIEKNEIIKQLTLALKKAGYTPPKKVYGKIIEYRGTQVTFSALGQKAPLYEKTEWNKKHDVRGKIKNTLKKNLNGFDAKVAGLTSIDVVRKGIDKAYGIRKVKKYFNMHTKDILFVGDMIIPGGNDYPVVKTGVDYIKVKSPQETKKIIQSLLS